MTLAAIVISLGILLAPQKNAADPTAGWQVYQPQDLRAEFRMPTEPNYRSASFEPVKDKPITVHQYLSTMEIPLKSGETNYVDEPVQSPSVPAEAAADSNEKSPAPPKKYMSFVVGYHDMVDPVTDQKHQNKILNGAVRGSVARVLGKLTVSKKINIQRYPGRQFEYECKYEQTTLKLTSRVCLVGQRLYQLNVVSPAENYDEKIVNAFFKSFRLVATSEDSESPDQPPSPDETATKD